jgi:signal peptidase I
MKKLRKQSKELLSLAQKVTAYRRDLMSTEAQQQFNLATVQLSTAIQDRGATKAQIQEQQRLLKQQLKEHGGILYGKGFFGSLVEDILVAVIVIIGIRSFFFQPFIIPTNSMYPTYSGMNSIVYTAEDAPSAAMRFFNKLRLGSSHFSVMSPTSGSVEIPFFSHAPNSPDTRIRRQQGGLVRYEIVAARKWFGLLPAQKRAYTLYVDGEPVQLQVPLDFNLDEVIRRRYLADYASLPEALQKLYQAGAVKLGQMNPLLKTEQTLAAGQPVLAFDITLGDALFVDRLTYHFKRPQVGDPFVFRTRNIPGIEGGVDKYYIKRIGGAGGETIEIKDGAIYSDGKLRDEVPAFVKNAKREGDYEGYLNINLLAKEQALTLPDDKFIALGDNSDNSWDSRSWGFVPDRSVIGKAIFIYYPFTRRWGLAE